MTPEQFAYWLQGFVELNGSEPTPEQWQSIKDHLDTVFVKVTPVRIGFPEVGRQFDTGKSRQDCLPKFPVDPSIFRGEPRIT